MADLIEKVYIDANVLVKGGFFLAKNIIMYASDEYKENAFIIEATDKVNNIFEVTDFYGSPYVEYYISGGLTLIDGGGKMTPEMISDDLLERTQKGLNEIRELLSVELPNSSLYPLFYREQHTAVMAEFENFLYCLILRELIFNEEVLLNNVRSFDYGKDKLTLKDSIDKTDNDLFKLLKTRISEIVYHRFVDVVLLYKIVFRKNIDSLISKIKGEVIKRHNVVHRNGRKLNGELEKLSKEDVLTFLDNTEASIINIWNLINN